MSVSAGNRGGLFRGRPFADGPQPNGAPPLRATGVSPTIAESWALRELAEESGTVLEVGTAWGYSSILMALAGAQVWTVDPHQDHGTLADFQRNLKDYRVEDRVSYWVAASQKILPELLRAGARFDACFVDGDHSYQACRHDVSYALQLVRPGGVIAVHDYTEAWPGVLQACDELLGELEPRRLTETLLLVKRPAG